MSKRPQILVHVREYFWDIYVDLVAGAEHFDFVFLPDFPRTGVAALYPRFHRLMQEGEQPRTAFDEEDIISRCRLLRNLPRARAVRMVRAMHAALKAHVDEHQWIMIIGQSVDDYITHLLSLLAASRGIPYLGFCSSYFPGYTQMTIGWNGACATGREPDRGECEAALKRVSGKFRQDYANMAKYNIRIHTQRVVRYWVKLGYFRILRQVRCAHHHIHYIFQPYLAQQKRFRDFVCQSSFHIDWERRLSAAKKTTVYIPLGYTPECSTDYMISNRRYIDYENTIYNITAVLSRTLTVVIKDHFHMLGIRRRAFYDRLRSISDVILVPPQVNSNGLLSLGIDRVLSGGGSVGIEATIRGKAVFSFSDTIYWMPRGGCRYLDLDQLSAWPQAIVETRAAPVDPLEFVRRCLDCTLPFDFMVLDGPKGKKVRALESFITQLMRSGKANSDACEKRAHGSR